MLDCMAARSFQFISSTVLTLYADSRVLSSVRVSPTDEKSLSLSLIAAKMASIRRATADKTLYLLACSFQKFSGPPEAAGTLITL